MSMNIKNVRYNPVNNTFECRVDIKRGRRFFRYPCSIEGPIDMPLSEVRRRLGTKALRMSDTPPDVFSTI